VKIKSVEPIVLGLPLAQPVQTSFGRMTHRYAILVRIETDDGTVGWGESWSNFPAWSPYERVHTIREGLAPLLVGEDPRQVQWLHTSMVKSTEKLALQWGGIGPISQAISALDIALWDLLGKETGQPIYRLLGGGSGKVPVYASGLGPNDPVRLARPLADAGVTAFKLKVGFGLTSDLQNLEAMRTFLGSEKLLLIDANQAWDLRTATAMMERFEPYQPYWLEEPLPADQIDELAELRRRLSCLVVAGENAYGRKGFLRLLQAGAVDIVQPDLCKTGGITEGLAICQMASGFNCGYAPHYLGGAVGLIASLHLCAATPGLWRMELDANPNPLRTELAGELLTVREGCLIAPDRPGLGFEPTPALIERYREHHL
jgi:D-galactarolactone cycloisomerase